MSITTALTRQSSSTTQTHLLHQLRSVFPTLYINPYDSQIEFVRAVKSAFNERGNIARPLSSSSHHLSRLSQIVCERSCSTAVTYRCCTLLHRLSANQVGRYFHNSNGFFALAAMKSSIKDKGCSPRIINSGAAETKKCRFAHLKPE